MQKANTFIKQKARIIMETDDEWDTAYLSESGASEYTIADDSGDEMSDAFALVARRPKPPSFAEIVRRRSAPARKSCVPKAGRTMTADAAQQATKGIKSPNQPHSHDEPSSPTKPMSGVRMARYDTVSAAL